MPPTLGVMAFRRRRRCSWLLLIATTALAAVLLCSQLAAAPAATMGNKRTGELTAFWGRNKAEGTLREACDTGLYNNVIISFYRLSGANGRSWLDLSGHPLASVGADIKHCQQAKGIPVFLSNGGGGDSKNYSLPSSESAEAVAAHLWNAFLGGGSTDVPLPFGDAVVDGIDFYIDNHGDGGASSSSDNYYYAELARRLDYFNTMYNYHATKKHVRLTRIHVRFYCGAADGEDDRCSYRKGETYGVVEQWEKWAAAYPKSQMYVGPAAAESGVPEGARPPVEVYLKYLYYDLLPKVQKAPNYGGVMVWDRFADKKTGYSTAVKGWASCSYGGCI